MISNRPNEPVFHEDDEVVLAKGPNQGTPGNFRQLREDTNWADITERNGVIRAHPMVWLALSPPSKAELPGRSPQ